MEYMDNKIWKIVNLIRGYGGNHEDVIDSLYRTLKLIDLGYDGSEPADTLYDEMLRKIKGFRVYRGNSRIFYEVFNLMKQLTHEGYFMVIDKVNEGMARTISDFAVPSELSQIMFNEITSDVKTVYIPDCEKFGYSLYEYVKENPEIQFFTSSYSIDMVELMKLLYKDTSVVFINHEYYKENFVFNKFDRIISVPAFGAAGLEGEGTFISKDSALIAAQNLLYHLTPKGKLTIVLPAKVTFGGGDSVQFREYINQNYKINSIYSLPNRVFHPYTNINTYLFNLSIGETEDIIIRKYTLDKGLILKDDNEKLMFIDEFNELNDWFIDVAFVEAFDELLDYSKSDIKKAKLNEVSSVFRGRAVSKKVEDGNVAVINISDITENGINYEQLDTIREEKRKIERYILEDGDVLITSRGTNVKVAVFKEQDKICIASSNINVVRTNPRIILGSYLKIFLESDIGTKLLQSIQRGSTIVNINYQDINMLEVPTPSLEEQNEIVTKYNSALENYISIITEAEKEWNKIKDDINNNLF